MRGETSADVGKKGVLQQKVTLAKGSMELETRIGTVPIEVNSPKNMPRFR